jgi:EAL domain-containing protein (putative c-di-GMP-specific phosphodiesterase class I)
LKLDRSFVNGITIDPDDAALVMAIVSLAHNLRLRVVAEGIETEEQLNFLRLLRCDEGQGYFFSPPQSSEVLEPLLLKKLPQPLPAQISRPISPNPPASIG